MATDVEQELLDVFERLGSSLSPAPDLAGRVRQRVRARRRRLVAFGAVAVVVLGGAGVVVGDRVQRSHHKVATPHPKFRESEVNVEAMAVTGNTLYVAGSRYPRGSLTAYDGTNGSLLGQARLPARPNSMAIGADGTVWVTFSPSNAGRQAGVAEFSSDLHRHSTLLTDDRYLDTVPFDVTPLGHDRALLATDRGLATVDLLPLRLQPIRAARATRSNARITPLPGQRFGPPTKLTALSDGNVAVVRTSADGQSRVVLTRGAAEFAGTQLTLAASPEGLWVTTGTGRRSVLQRLSNTLSPLPVGAVLDTVSLPGGANRVWTSGRTVWVATDGHRLKLACFAFSSPTQEPSAAVSLPAVDSAQVTNPVVTGDLTIAPTRQRIYVAGAFGITSYRVPTVCQSPL